MIRTNISNFAFIIWLGVTLFIIQGCKQESAIEVMDNNDSITVHMENYTLAIEKDGFRYEFKSSNGEIIVPAHAISGMQIGSTPDQLEIVIYASLEEYNKNSLRFEVDTQNDIKAEVIVELMPNRVKFSVYPFEEEKYTIVGRTNGISPAFGLGDHAIYNVSSVDVTGFSSENYSNHGGNQQRLISNFVIFPKQGFATVNIEPLPKIVRVTEEENAQGTKEALSMPSLNYFIGTSEEIYREFLFVRNHDGFPVFKPKYEFFGVGWEAWGALAWNTTHETVKENINQYLDLGFPLEWMVIGSGFWPSGEGEFDEHGTPYQSETELEEAKKLQATTSFGMWDKQKYPDPDGMIDYFHDLGLKVILGLRIAFIPEGPFTNEGLNNGYFLKDEEGKAHLFEIGFPREPVYLLDAHNLDALEWYIELVQKWLDYGVDGFKEDLYGYASRLPHDIIDPTNRAMMEKGVYVMGRNMYLGSPTDIHRYNDFNLDQNQDRGPINGLAYAYSGFPYVYPDIVGGTFADFDGRHVRGADNTTLRRYLMRYAEYAALHPSMSFGYGPWNFNDEVVEVTRNAAMLHDRLQPYTYSYSIKAYETGFPYPMTPLPLAYPDDPGVYALADTTRRSYQWLIGESLLATPLYGDDYDTATSRDVYLPEGTWMEYDSGEIHQGPTTLQDYPLPIGKTPLFVGGKGIVVEEIDGELKGRIYPVTDSSEIVFYDKDGETKSTITIENPNWDVPTVTNVTTGDQVTGSWNRHAYEFLFEPGTDYRIE